VPYAPTRGYTEPARGALRRAEYRALRAPDGSGGRGGDSDLTRSSPDAQLDDRVPYTLAERAEHARGGLRRGEGAEPVHGGLRRGKPLTSRAPEEADGRRDLRGSHSPVGQRADQQVPRDIPGTAAASHGAQPSASGRHTVQTASTVAHDHRVLSATVSTGFLPLPISVPPCDVSGDVRSGAVAGARRNWTASQVVEAPVRRRPGAEDGNDAIGPSSRPAFGATDFNSTCVGPFLGGVLRELASPPSSSGSGGDREAVDFRLAGRADALPCEGVDREVVCSLVNAPPESLVSKLNFALHAAGVEQVPVARRASSAGPRVVVDSTKLVHSVLELVQRRPAPGSQASPAVGARSGAEAGTPRSEKGTDVAGLEDTQARTPDVTYVKAARTSPSEGSPCDTDDDGPGKMQDAAARRSAEYKLAGLGAQVRELEHANRKLERRMARLVKALEDSNAEVHRLTPCYSHAQVLAQVCDVLQTDFDGAVGSAAAAVSAAANAGAAAAFSEDVFRIVSEMARSHGAPETFSHDDAVSKIRSWAAAADDSWRFEQFRTQVTGILGGAVQTDQQIVSEVQRLCGCHLPPEKQSSLILSRVMEILRVVEVSGVVPALCVLERRHNELENFWKTLCSAADQDFRKATLTSLSASLRIDLCHS